MLENNESVRIRVLGTMLTMFQPIKTDYGYFLFRYQGLEFHPSGSMKQAGGGDVQDFFLIKKKCKNIS